MVPERNQIYRILGQTAWQCCLERGKEDTKCGEANERVEAVQECGEAAYECGGATYERVEEVNESVEAAHEREE